LDRYFYTTEADSPLHEFISRLRVGARQVIERPMLIIDAVKTMNLKAFYVPDRKRILIDESVPKLKHRWIEAHEITHDLLPWHHEMMLGDTAQTLTPTCHEMLEGDANYGAGQLLFLRDRFINEARSSAVSFATVQALKKRFGNTMTTTLWRYVESVFPDRPMFGVVSVHPHPDHRPDDFNPLDPCRYYIRSAAWRRRVSRARALASPPDTRRWPASSVSRRTCKLIATACCRSAESADEARRCPRAWLADRKAWRCARGCR
jgi:hypothetical protein